MMPALFIWMSMSPRNRSASLTASRTEPSLITSQPMPVALPPAAMINRAVSSAPDLSISATATRAPRPANSSAMTRPILRPAPMMKALLFSNVNIGVLPLYAHFGEQCRSARNASAHRTVIAFLLDQGAKNLQIEYALVSGIEHLVHQTAN